LNTTDLRADLRADLGFSLIFTQTWEQTWEQTAYIIEQASSTIAKLAKPKYIRKHIHFHDRCAVTFGAEVQLYMHGILAGSGKL